MMANHQPVERKMLLASLVTQPLGLAALIAGSINSGSANVFNIICFLLIYALSVFLMLRKPILGMAIPVLSVIMAFISFSGSSSDPAYSWIGWLLVPLLIGGIVVILAWLPRSNSRAEPEEKRDRIKAVIIVTEKDKD